MRKNKCLLHITLMAASLALLLTSPLASLAQSWNPSHAIGAVTGVNHYSYNQVPSQLVEISAAAAPNTGLSYQWEQSFSPVTDFEPIVGAIQSSYSPSPLSQTTYFRRKTTGSSGSIYSNTVKIQVVSATWEDRNYVRQHGVRISGVTTWQAVDALPIGDKLQTTSYVDGLGRSVQQISKETATPTQPNGQWGDMVQFSEYDAMGREVQKYLPYATTTESGKFKTAPATEQAQYYATTYNETSAYNQIVFDNSPLNRVKNMKQAGFSWANSIGSTAKYETNDATDNVQLFSVAYTQGSLPEHKGIYPANTLYKLIYVDQDLNKVIEYTDKNGKLILKKVQIEDAPSAAHDGWICTYSIYDDFWQLRFQLQPEAVKYLDTHSWSFAGTDGQKVLDELCFQYYYDEKGRTTWKKAPGAKPLQMLYDIRDRVVFMQDGNQRTKSPAEWTANLYDELDRPIITTLYHTNKSVADLQTDINNAVTSSGITTTQSGQPITDLSISTRDISILQYKARTSIEFVPEFESAVTDEFTAEIDPAAAEPSTTISIASYKAPITNTDLNNPAICTILKYQFYDNYAFSGTKPFATDFDNSAAYSSSTPDVQPIATTKRIIGFPTSSRVRVLGTNQFLNATSYYDERGAQVQTTEDNIKAGKDVVTVQYHFDGRVLSTYTTHSTANSSYTGFATLTKNNFDKIGRVTSIQKRWGSNAFKTIAEYSYDDMGRLKNKRLDPGYTGSGKTELEALSYSYNIHNNITGINKDYALKAPGNYNKWGNFFGLYLGYDNRDGVFTAANLNGQVTGLLWNTQGDDAQRKYDYTYDNAGRLINAVFKERPTTGDAWSNAKMDFGVTGAGGKIGYDLNGNLLSMIQKGVKAGSTAPVVVDDLQYSYAALTNKLMKVTDASPLGADNGKQGDFKDGANGTADDYVYDDNGNVVIDLNKGAKDLANVSGAAGIRYNFLDKPEEIRIAGKGTIKLVYDAEGTKLQKLFTPEGTTNTVTTTYINGYVYQETSTAGEGQGLKLQYISFEEGRIRVMQPVAENNSYDFVTIAGNMSLPDGKQGSLDYYIRDYQQNVRMILTEETHIGSNQATMEAGRASNEESLFGQTGSGNEVAATRFPVSSIPGEGWQHPDIQNQVSRLGALAPKKTGPNALLKVMSGDEISSFVQYYYKEPVSNGTGNNLLTDVLGSLISAISGSAVTTPGVKDGASGIGNNLSGPTPFADAVAPDANNSNGNNPKAYLNILFFNERFEFVQEGSTALRVQGAGNGQTPLLLTNIKAPKNGYCYVYLSNESNEPVYFDNFKVTHNRGRIIEENHYYSYGLKIAAISSTKVGDAREGHLENKYGYQGAFSEMDEDIGWNDFALRNYDPQIGRWVQQDPYDEYPSPYTGMGNNPVNLIDPTGGASWPPSGLGQIASFAKEGGVMATVLISTTRVVGGGAKAISAIQTGLKIAEIVVRTGQIVNVISKAATAYQAGDLSYESLSNNPDLYGLGLGELRGMVRDYSKDLEQWQINISAGLLLEDLYESFSGLTKNNSARTIIGPNPNGFRPVARTIVPDFFPGTELVGDAVFPDGGITEVKAVQEQIDLGTSRYQVAAEISTASRATPYREGKPDYGSKNAGQRKAGAITFVLPADRSVADNLIRKATAYGVNIFVSYAFINIKTRNVVFSTPQKLNKISKMSPYPVRGTINGVSPNLDQATKKWRISDKKDIDE